MVCDPDLPLGYCIVDGLDECEPISLDSLLVKISVYFSQRAFVAKCRIKFAFFSREKPELIFESLSQFPSIRLDELSDSGEDVKRFITAKTQELSRRRTGSQAV